jgi:hypothetical protein
MDVQHAAFEYTVSQPSLNFLIEAAAKQLATMTLKLLRKRSLAALHHRCDNTASPPTRNANFPVYTII